MTIASPPGPVSAALEADLREYVRRHGVAVWLDLDGHYGGFVDELVARRAKGDLPYEVRAFRGSYLELMLALEAPAGGSGRTPLVVHLPGHTEESVAETPLFELYKAGARYRKRLDTLVVEAASGRVPPEAIEVGKERAVDLGSADAWLRDALEGGARQGSGLRTQLEGMTPGAVMDDLLSDGFIARQLPESAGTDAGGAQAALMARFAAWTGLPGDWAGAGVEKEGVGRVARARGLAYAVASWALAVEYVSDLDRAPVIALLGAATSLPGGVVEACCGLATHLRDRHPTFYTQTADDTELRLAEEVKAARAEDLGRIDTFRFEEQHLLGGALEALAAGDFSRADDWAKTRLARDPKSGARSSFWLRQDPTREPAWQLVLAAARLGTAIKTAGARLGGVSEIASLEVAMAQYVERGAAVDRAHRQLEQRRAALLFPRVPEFEVLRTQLDAMRERHAVWADAWALDWNAICRAYGFLPDAAYQQRTLFEEVVRPMTQDGGTTAYFVVDALRYEMAEELYAEVAESAGSTAHLRPRLSELPSVTEVGMNALAPVANKGRLTLAMDADGAKVRGMRAGEFTVFNPDTRQRAMAARVGGRTCPWLSLEEVLARETSSLKLSIAQARLVVVHSQEIDKSGETGMGLRVFESELKKLKAAWRLLREAGVNHFVFTSDHGFLLLDERRVPRQSHGRRVDPKRRHVFSKSAADHTGEVRVPLAALGYEGAEGHLMFPETTAVFDTGKKGMSFVHGGNSAQERVIPVLTVTHRRPAGGSTTRYAVRVQALDGVAGMHCIEVSVAPAESQAAFAFSAAKEVELDVRAAEGEGVGVMVELCQVRGGAKLEGGVLRAAVGERFEVFFRLDGPAESRVRVEVYHPSGAATVDPASPEARFTVLRREMPESDAGSDVSMDGVDAAASTGEAPSPAQPPRPRSVPPASHSPGGPGAGWLDELPDGGVREVFAHLEAHGAVTETEMATMLGTTRKVRSFALHFEEHAKRAPFRVRIDIVGGVKRYVREAGG